MEEERIVKVHRNNFRVIEENNIKIGTELTNQITGERFVVTHIHSLYGWVLVKRINQLDKYHNHMVNLEKIDDYKVDNKKLILKALENGS